MEDTSSGRERASEVTAEDEAGEAASGPRKREYSGAARRRCEDDDPGEQACRRGGACETGCEREAAVAAIQIVGEGVLGWGSGAIGGVEHGVESLEVPDDGAALLEADRCACAEADAGEQEADAAGDACARGPGRPRRGRCGAGDGEGLWCRGPDREEFVPCG
jgi:hypothetical protein